MLKSQLTQSYSLCQVKSNPLRAFLYSPFGSRDSATSKSTYSRDLIAVSIHDKHPVRLSIRPMCTSCCFTMTHMIQECRSDHPLDGLQAGDSVNHLWAFSPKLSILRQNDINTQDKKKLRGEMRLGHVQIHLFKRCCSNERGTPPRSGKRRGLGKAGK